MSPGLHFEEKGGERKLERARENKKISENIYTYILCNNICTHRCIYAYCLIMNNYAYIPVYYAKQTYDVCI